MKQFTLVIDVDRCLGCKSCQVACKVGHRLELGVNRINVEEIGPFEEFPNLTMYYLPLTCQQCDEPECVKVCPKEAIKKDEDGIVKIDHQKCICCRQCENNCPYGAITFNDEKKIMDKCNLCSNVIPLEKTPYCVKICPGRALHYGDVYNPESEVSKILKSTPRKYLHKLNKNNGNTSIIYILRKAKWVDIY